MEPFTATLEPTVASREEIWSEYTHFVPTIIALYIVDKCIFCENVSVSSYLSVTVLNLLMLIVNLSGLTRLYAAHQITQSNVLYLAAKFGRRHKAFPEL